MPDVCWSLPGLNLRLGGSSVYWGHGFNGCGISAFGMALGGALRIRAGSSKN